MTFSDLLSPRLPMHGEPHWTGEEAAAFDLYLQDEMGIPASLLMENAGQATARFALAQLQQLSPPPQAPIVVLAGPGNNGGDALVAARGMHRACPASLVIWAPLGLPADAPSPAGLARDAVVALGLPIQLGPSAPDCLLDAALILDGLFGVGLDRALAGPAAAAVEAIDSAPGPVLALDLPSGLEADTGEVLGVAPRAHATLSYIGVKRGLATASGPQLAGEVWTASIGVAPAIAQDWLASRRDRA